MQAIGHLHDSKRQQHEALLEQIGVCAGVLLVKERRHGNVIDGTRLDQQGARGLLGARRWCRHGRGRLRQQLAQQIRAQLQNVLDDTTFAQRRVQHSAELGRGVCGRRRWSVGRSGILMVLVALEKQRQSPVQESIDLECRLSHSDRVGLALRLDAQHQVGEFVRTLVGLGHGARRVRGERVQRTHERQRKGAAALADRRVLLQQLCEQQLSYGCRRDAAGAGGDGLGGLVSGQSVLVRRLFLCETHGHRELEQLLFIILHVDHRSVERLVDAGRRQRVRARGGHRSGARGGARGRWSRCVVDARKRRAGRLLRGSWLVAFDSVCGVVRRLKARRIMARLTQVIVLAHGAAVAPGVRVIDLRRAAVAQEHLDLHAGCRPRRRRRRRALELHGNGRCLAVGIVRRLVGSRGRQQVDQGVGRGGSDRSEVRAQKVAQHLVRRPRAAAGAREVAQVAQQHDDEALRHVGERIDGTRLEAAHELPVGADELRRQCRVLAQAAVKVVGPLGDHRAYERRELGDAREVESRLADERQRVRHVAELARVLEQVVRVGRGVQRAEQLLERAMQRLELRHVEHARQDRVQRLHAKCRDELERRHGAEQLDDLCGCSFGSNAGDRGRC